LASHHRELAAGLRRVAGCVELGLRVLWQGGAAGPTNGSVASGNVSEGQPPPGVDAPGRAYMAARLVEERRRRDERERAQRLADELQAPLSAAAVENTCRVLAAPQLLLTAAYLVRREATEAFRQSVERLASAHPDLRLLCTGPWPPYHFVPSIVDPAGGIL
jgi:hypothetical protein